VKWEWTKAVFSFPPTHVQKEHFDYCSVNFACSLKFAKIVLQSVSSQSDMLMVRSFYADLSNYQVTLKEFQKWGADQEERKKPLDPPEAL